MKNAIVMCLALTGAFTFACKAKRPAEDPNKLVILKATWGAMDDSAIADVTQKVAGMVQGNALEVEAVSRVLGDPASFKLKELRVEYTKGGVFAKKRAAENEFLRIPLQERPVPIRLVIRKALYGNFESGQTIDVTKRVADMVVNNNLTVTPTNALFGDPAAFKAKELHVDYTVDGVAKSKVAKEDETLTASAAEQPPAK